jgi:hypothetical protein
MIPEKDIKAIDDKIKTLRRTAEDLERLTANIPAINKNTARILASVKMLELNISDCVDPDIIA